MALPKTDDTTEDVQPKGAAELREELQAWLADQWDPEITLREWWARLFEGAWTSPSWPKEWYGRGLSGDLSRIVAEEIRAHGAPGGPGGLGIMLAGPTIITHGTDEQRARYLPPMLKGEEAWCQLFSEPNAGSDLAALQTRAEADGEEWIINGQKVWSSGGHIADLGMLIARTDTSVPKHQGITYMIIEMDQPGIEVRPIREMTGRALFNEVFMDNARVKTGCVLGGLGNGWAVANTTLANERSGLGGGSEAAGGLAAGEKGGLLDKRAGDLSPKKGPRTGTGAVFAAFGSSLLVDQARQLGKDGDLNVRQDLARLYTLEQISKFTALRVKAASKSGRGPGPEVSTMKLNMSRMIREARETGLSILGAHGMLLGSDSMTGGLIQEMALFSPAPSIYGGTDQIQKNIIGERVLGLPREPRSDKDVPFKDLLVGRVDAAAG